MPAYRSAVAPNRCSDSDLRHDERLAIETLDQLVRFRIALEPLVLRVLRG